VTPRSRSMFWRSSGQLLRASRGRLTVALIALSSGRAISSALAEYQFWMPSRS